MTRSTDQTTGDAIASAIRSGCDQAGWSQRELARRLGTNQSAVKRLVSPGAASLDVHLATDALRVLGRRVTIDGGGPGFTDRQRQRDEVHARCCSYVVRAMRRSDWDVRTEVETGDGRSRGWIDVLAFRQADRALVVFEVKTRLDDAGRTLRTLGWYARTARNAAQAFGWRPRIVTPSLLLLFTDESELRLTAAAELIRSHLPGTAADLAAWLADPSAPRPEPTLALLDPRRRGGQWLIRPRLQGGRSRAPYRDYADGAAALRGSSSSPRVPRAGAQTVTPRRAPPT